MKRNYDLRRLLRWYPEKWRERYQEEFVALLEDKVGDGSPRIALRWTVAVAGVRERVRESDVLGVRGSLYEQRRRGALVVLVAWAVMSVGVMSLFKTAEHYSHSLPVGSRSLAETGYRLVVVGGVIGTIVVVLGALIALPSLFGHLRENGWSYLREALLPALMTSLVTLAGILALSLWAHHLTSIQRNGGDRAYVGAFLVVALLVTLSAGAWARAVVKVASVLVLSPSALLYEGVLALVAALCTVVMASGAVTWWVQMARHAPWFLQGSTAGVAVSPWSSPVMFSAAIMAVATAIAVAGASRVALSVRSA